MIPDAFPIQAVARALGTTVTSVEVVERFAASAADVARLRVRFPGGRAALTVIGKSATGAGVAALHRELRFFRRIAPLCDSGAPALLGASEHGLGDRAHVLLLTEDLSAAGYALVGGTVSDLQLHGAIDALVRLHARFWNDLPLGDLEPTPPAPSVTQSAQAWPPEIIAKHAAAARDASRRFVAGAGHAITPGERAWLDEILEVWEPRFSARVAGGRAITLIHADFHILGNVLFAAGDPRPRIVDWSELKPGLGPHDLAYLLVAVPTDDRPARDGALLRAYWERLSTAGVDGYSWELCRWDHRFSLITNLLQSLLQGSVAWFRKSLALLEALECRAALRDPPPVA